ncbi:PREDICTED: eukaryotic translation initiation factor 3 subunit I [Lipotes vexillifer]|uniref:Eukaryotic translation initiation factor 3 subunit I n=2 Tax=Laurasiatheria TaxID=314145 RepID=A0A340Y674_LIPVE|nr:PREDICTED: eukaryotic translation initiation factor 3 subunit I [Lipotes vexillifer]
MRKLRLKADKGFIQELLASKWWNADSDPDLFDSRDQILSGYPRERGHSPTNLSIQEEGLRLLQQLPGPGPLMNLLQVRGGPLQQRLCATPQSGHQHQSQHLPWMEMRGRIPVIRKWCQSLFRFCSCCFFPRVTAGMKPILLQGHERSITQIKYNREGDLLFTVAKDPIVNVWYSVNGERLGTYMGHTGAVWCVDADWDTKHVLTGSADNSCRLWDCETGKQLALLKTNSAVRTCGFDFGGNIIMFSTDKQMGYQCFVSFFDLRDPSQIDSNEPYMKIPCNDSKITSAVWGPLGECIIAGHEGGELNQYSAKSGEVLVTIKEHSRQINDIQLSRDMTMFVTASKDNTAKLFDSTTLEHQKTFRTERPVNSAALSPNYDHVVLGGGQEAMDVTTTSTRIGKFEARFFHLAFEEEFGRIKGHFGPINSVAFHPDGKSYSSGGEDGYVRIHYFDPQYFEFEFEA